MLGSEHCTNRVARVIQDFSFSRRCFDAALITLLAVASLFVIARIGLKPRDPANGVAVMFAPWTSAEATLARATDPGSRFVRYGGFPFIAVVIPERADYPERMLAGGAVFVLDPQALAACFSGLGLKSQSQ
jgi:hypothetical protein